MLQNHLMVLLNTSPSQTSSVSIHKCALTCLLPSHTAFAGWPQAPLRSSPVLQCPWPGQREPVGTPHTCGCPCRQLTVTPFLGHGIVYVHEARKLGFTLLFTKCSMFWVIKPLHLFHFQMRHPYPKTAFRPGSDDAKQKTTRSPQTRSPGAPSGHCASLCRADACRWLTEGRGQTLLWTLCSQPCPELPECPSPTVGNNPEPERRSAESHALPSAGVCTGFPELLVS